MYSGQAKEILSRLSSASAGGACSVGADAAASVGAAASSGGAASSSAGVLAQAANIKMSTNRGNHSFFTSLLLLSPDAPSLLCGMLTASRRRALAVLGFLCHHLLPRFLPGQPGRPLLVTFPVRRHLRH